MPREVYEVVAQGARYWFLFLMAVIVWRSYRWLAKDRRQRKKRLKLLPDAGFIGEMVVQSGNEELEEGMALLVPREGILGTLRGSDLYVPVEGIAKKHLWFRYEDRRGLMIRTFAGRRAGVDGEECAGRRKAAYMAHGSRLYVGEAVLRLRMFAGFETTAYAMPRETAEDKAQGEDQGQTAAMDQMAQIALWQEQQKAMREWFLAQQAAQAEAGGEPVGFDDEADAMDDMEPLDDADGTFIDMDELDEQDLREIYGRPKGHAQDMTPSYVVLTDGGAAEAGEQSRRGRRSLFNPFTSAAEEFAATAAQETIFTPSEAFFPPALEETGTAEDDFWPYAEYPQSNAVFENKGYTYPEAVVSEDEDLTDAAAPPKSLYVEPDEAERAKRLLWDKYLGGGIKR